jgi:hypothetical protein
MPRAEKKYMSEKSIRVLCALAYAPFPFLGFAMAMIGFKVGSSEIRKHGLNSIIIQVAYLVGSFFVVPMFLSGSFYLFQDIFNVEKFLQVVLTTPLWMNVIFTFYQLYLMVRVFKNIHYIPFFSPFRGII